MRICRIARQYPRASQPGALLAAYILSERLPYPCLYVAKVLDGPPIVTFSGHVTPLFIAYPEPSFPEGYKVSKVRMALVAAGKLLGNLIFTIRALPHFFRFKPDLFHVHTPLPIMPALVYKMLTRKPIVLTFHGTDYYRFRTSRLTRWMIRKFVDYVICITPEQPDDFHTLMPDVPATYVQNGVDLSVFSPDTSVAKRKQVVTVGRLTWQKGYDDLIKAMAKVIALEPDYRLVIVGDGSLHDKLSAIAQEVGIADKVEFTGMIPQGDVVKILRESELYVMSSVSEGFPKALIEAMSCALPIVVTDIGACAPVAKNAGLVVPPAQPEALAEAILTMIRNPQQRQAYAEQALRDAQRYGWEKHVQEVRAIYEHVLSTKTRDANSRPATLSQ